MEEKKQPVNGNQEIKKAVVTPKVEEKKETVVQKPVVSKVSVDKPIEVIVAEPKTETPVDEENVKAEVVIEGEAKKLSKKNRKALKKVSEKAKQKKKDKKAKQKEKAKKAKKKKKEKVKKEKAKKKLKEKAAKKKAAKNKKSKKK